MSWRLFAGNYLQINWWAFSQWTDENMHQTKFCFLSQKNSLLYHSVVSAEAVYTHFPVCMHCKPKWYIKIIGVCTDLGLLELKERKIRYMQEYLVTRTYLEDVYHSGKLNAKTSHAFRGFIKGWWIMKLARCWITYLIYIVFLLCTYINVFAIILFC